MPAVFMYPVLNLALLLYAKNHAWNEKFYKTHPGFISCECMGTL